MRFLAVVQLGQRTANVDVLINGDRPTLAEIREIEQAVQERVGSSTAAALINMIPLADEG